MKPAPFHYVAPRSVEEAVGYLAEFGDDGKILAGGQSLVPAMNFRLARPGVVVDIGNLDHLRYIVHEGGELRIGALARHADAQHVAGDGVVTRALRLVAPHIGHPAIRNRGTVCGSLAHADPAAEWCVVAAALDARFVLRSSTGERIVPADQFFLSVLSTALSITEILVEARMTDLPDGCGVGFCEISRRPGDFAIAMAFAAVTAEHGRITSCRLALGGVDSVPVRDVGAERSLIGAAVSDEAARAEVARLTAARCDPVSDMHADAEYRRHVAGVLAERALSDACHRIIESTV